MFIITEYKTQKAASDQIALTTLVKEMSEQMEPDNKRFFALNLKL